MKWTRPCQGACLTCKAGGNVYIIAEDKLGEHRLVVRPDRKAKRKKFGTYRDMYREIAGQDPEDSYSQKVHAKAPKQLTEKDIRSMIHYELTYNPGAGGNLRTYCRDGQDYAVDMSGKEIWPYWIPQPISPTFYKESECREWADLYLEERYGQVSLFDIMEGATP